MSQIQTLLETMEWGPAPEDAKPALAWLEGHGRSFGHFVGGAWRTGDRHFATVNPATGAELAQIAQGSADDVAAAVAAARAAQPDWAARPGEERAAVLYAIARQIQKNSRLFAVLETLDNGKPIRESRDLDIPLAARHFYHHAGWATLMESEFAEYGPVGVCGQIIPWNFPLLMLAWKIAPAIAMGNTVVLKPAEFTSLTALLFAEICVKAGVPAGAINIVTGDGETGKAIVSHPDIDKIAFTGSTEVGRLIRQATAEREMKLSLELGGKSPYIVFEDADLDSAIEGLVDAIWFNQGQVCCAGSRLLVQESISDAFLARLKARMDKLRTGDPLDKAVDLGAVVDRTQLERIHQLVEIGVQEGAEKYQPACEFPEGGWFYPPTLLSGVEPAATVAQTEIFGPVLVAMTFRTPAEAVALANNTVYGLASSVWTQNLDVAHDVASQIQAGTVWVNCTNQFDGAVGFGGYRESGYGREGGREGVFEYLKWRVARADAQSMQAVESGAESGLDRTHKLYVGGKQVRPDGGYSFEVGGHSFALANRKDVRNAVEAAEGAFGSWRRSTPYLRSQILYYLAENLTAARGQLVAALVASGVADAEAEFDESVRRVLHFAAWADKYDGAVHQGPGGMHVYTRNEPLGVVAAIAPSDRPLLGLLGVCLPLVAMGNAVVAVASEAAPLPAVELYRILEASDVPAGVWNVLTGSADELLETLGGHLGVASVWAFGAERLLRRAQSLSAGNLKQTFGAEGVDWMARPGGEWLRRATQVKNVWVPYGA